MDLEKILEKGLVIFIALAAIAFSVSILFLVLMSAVKEKKKRARCTERVVAEVIHFTDVSFYDREKDTTYSERAPVYEYSYKGELCRCTGKCSGSWIKKKPAGTHVELLVDPENPRSFICPEEERHGRIQAIKGICIFVGAVMLVVLGIYLTKTYLESLSEF
ncbi:Protein of unknown function [Ruminococcus flavefaciens]|uniref:DUF3592 domain-containing protein n=2 Tax=Ruminococcus flavefaciens TaxID=1265 RepID=A0A1M7INJ5_RUMFL|nr:DUF3592 domain-containing protein [Ruminococcus flavefaciens]SHM41957.1 Protein of unknown function [Ruminococcus flavefaciens]